MGRHKERSMTFPHNFPSISYRSSSINYKASFSFWAGEPDKEDFFNSRSHPETTQALGVPVMHYVTLKTYCIPAVLLPAGSISSSKGILSLQAMGRAKRCSSKITSAKSHSSRLCLQKQQRIGLHSSNKWLAGHGLHIIGTMLRHAGCRVPLLPHRNSLGTLREAPPTAF